MRKGLIFLLGIVSFFGINTVNAAEIKLEYDTNINEINSFISLIGSDKVFQQINELIELYNSDYASNYPYYVISLGDGLINQENFTIHLHALTSEGTSEFSVATDGFGYFIDRNSDYVEIMRTYDSETNLFNEEIFHLTGRPPILFLVTLEEKYYSPYAYYYSNFDLYYDGSFYADIYNNNQNLTINPNDNLLIPSFEDSNIYSVKSVDSKFLIEPYYLYDDNEYITAERFINIDLNQYSYIALSLKDYSETETFYTNMYVKGQLCLTPVYNYGMTEKTEYYPGYQIDRCSPYYEDFTLVRTYILEQDLKNNAIYYLKAYDITKDNIVKVDSSIFNITYITEEQKDKPYVSIGGKTYPTISYDNLSSSSTKSEEEGYISGVVCQVGDFNCYVEHNPSNIFDDIFSSPLKFLEDIWESVTSIFTLITEFITLLPPMMQSFLYLSFMVAVILGLLKIIL